MTTDHPASAGLYLDSVTPRLGPIGCLIIATTADAAIDAAAVECKTDVRNSHPLLYDIGKKCR
jgi:hypothetical protein